MKKRKSKAFTLIELLSVILILGVIALIAIPAINNIIAEAEINSILSNMHNLIDAGEKYYMRTQYANMSCIDVNNPDLNFDNKLGSITGFICYDDDKGEAYLKDVIYEDYFFTGTTDDLVLSEIDRSIKPVYTLEEQYFDGVDDYVDTGYTLFDEDKDFTLVISVTSNSKPSASMPPTIFHCMLESSSYPGIVFDQWNSGGRISGFIGSNNAVFPKVIYKNKSILVLKRDKTSSSFNYYIFGSDGVVVETNKKVKTITTFNQNLLLGAYQTTDGTKGRFFNGTIHYFGLYMEALDDGTIKSIMNELK